MKPDDLLFTDSTFGKINFEAKEGGTCSFATRVQILPNAAEAAKPMMLLKHEVLATLDTPNASNTTPAKH